MEQKKFEDPLRDVETKYRTGKKLEEWGRFHQEYNAYKNKLNHLFIIYNSYVKRYPAFKKNMELNRRMIERTKMHDFTITDEEVQESKQNAMELEFIEIDYEDFFLHSRILLDYLTRLSMFFFNLDIAFSREYYYGIPNRYKSFHDHKNWLKDDKSNHSHDHILKEYKEYIINKTDWFEELKEFRDKILVHPMYFRQRGMSQFKDNKETLPVWFGNKEVNSITIKLPDIEKMMDNISQFLEFLKSFYTYLLTGKIYKTIFSFGNPNGKIWFR